MRVAGPLRATRRQTHRITGPGPGSFSPGALLAGADSGPTNCGGAKRAGSTPGLTTSVGGGSLTYRRTASWVNVDTGRATAASPSARCMRGPNSLAPIMNSPPWTVTAYGMPVARRIRGPRRDSGRVALAKCTMSKGISASRPTTLDWKPGVGSSVATRSRRTSASSVLSTSSQPLVARVTITTSAGSQRATIE